MNWPVFHYSTARCQYKQQSDFVISIFVIPLVILKSWIVTLTNAFHPWVHYPSSSAVKVLSISQPCSARICLCTTLLLLSWTTPVINRCTLGFSGNRCQEKSLKCKRLWKKRGRSIICQGEIPDHEADLSEALSDQWGVQGKNSPLGESQMGAEMARSLYDCMGSYAEKCVMSVWMMRQSLKKLTAVSANHTPHKTSSFLAILELFQICHRYW